jgi:hypothetical protein
MCNLFRFVIRINNLFLVQILLGLLFLMELEMRYILMKMMGLIILHLGIIMILFKNKVGIYCKLIEV